MCVLAICRFDITIMLKQFDAKTTFLLGSCFHILRNKQNTYFFC